ncbi:hypothetical protein R1sor_015349 [Riccia sorocarpa]|uniref:Uncharacterized protein n=1 Tax=Riccia sorocarpa TaxID=122646 RepID=A0ABD3HC03_9MARC
MKPSGKEAVALSVAFGCICLKRIPLGLFLASVFFLFKAFSFEKMMYMSDLYGGTVKSGFWKLASKLVEITETNRLRWRGGFAYCSPYSRKFLQVKTDVYYTLKPGVAPDEKVPDSYKVEFNIESCKVVCKYSAGASSKEVLQEKVEEYSAVNQRDGSPERERVELYRSASLTATDSTLSSLVSDADILAREGSLSRSPSFTSPVPVRSPSFNSSQLPGPSPVPVGSSPVHIAVQHSRSPSHTSVVPQVLTRSPSHQVLSRSPSVPSVSGFAEPFSRSPSTRATGPQPVTSAAAAEQDSDSSEKGREEGSNSLPVDGQESPPEEEGEGTRKPEAYGLNKIQLQKLEASLWHGDLNILGFTYYQVEPEAVLEVKRVLEVLRDRGNLVFSDLHRNVGSRNLEARARCYDFEEMLYLIIHRGYRLHMVKLLGTYTCYVSGTHALVDVMGVLMLVLVVYFQLATATKPLCYLLFALYFIWELFQITRQPGGHTEFCLDLDFDMARRGVYYLIKAVADPEKISSIYGWLHDKIPLLAFNNESYGHPYYSVGGQEEICSLFTDECTALPIVDVGDYELILQKELPPPLEVQRYNLKNIQMEMTLRRGDPTREDEWKVEILMQRSYDDKMLSYWYRRIFVTVGGRVRNLIAIMEWLVRNDCLGVCKEWLDKNRIQAYPYLELFTRVLQEGVEPWIIIPSSRAYLTVE